MFLCLALALGGVPGCGGFAPDTTEDSAVSGIGLETATIAPTIAEPNPLIPTKSEPTPVKVPPALYISPAVPRGLAELVSENSQKHVVENIKDGDFSLEIAFEHSSKVGSRWVYALVAPFPTVRDGYSLVEIKGLWNGEAGANSEVVFLTAETLAGLTALWGEPGSLDIRIANKDELLNLAWAEKNSLAIIPFEEISPRWKVLKVDGLTPLDKHLNIDLYPLAINFQWVARPDQNAEMVLPPPALPAGNREADKMTTLVLTGTTALARSIAAKMVENGVEYPLGDIAGWLQDADITHISNEVSFYEQCPPAVPVRREMRFCSDPDFIRLFEAAGVDVIESTGNHLLDWGPEAFAYTLGLYEKYGFKYYGGGMNLAEARQPLILEHAGTKLALIGCNIAGPDNDWATESTAGTAPCDLEWMSEQVRSLRSKGILPVVSFQHYELDDFMPMNLTRQHFQLMAEAGAVIVSGSQAHFPHGFGFYNDVFMHYGLGNLFFDQMYEGYRREFIDRHIFYDGRYLGVELLTAMLEDSSRPRPMTDAERAQTLAKYFEVSGW